MNFEDFKELAEQGKLRFDKYLYHTNTRIRYLYSDEPDILDQKIIGTRTEKYRIFKYQVRTPNMDKHQSFNLRKRDFEELLKIQNEPTRKNLK